MKKLWTDFSARIDAMTLRERSILFAAAACVLIVFVYSLWIDADFAKSGRLTREIAQRQAEMKSLQDEIGKMGRMREADPDRVNRERLAALRTELAAIESRIGGEEHKFTAPEQMRNVLEELVARNHRIRLVSLKTLPVSSIADEKPAAQPGEEKSASQARLIYRHGVELTVVGTYLDLLSYLSALEKLPTQLYWNGLEMQVTDYPAVTMKLTVFTLSLDRAWLNV